MLARLRISAPTAIVLFALLVSIAIIAFPTFSQAQGLLSCSGLDCQYCHLFKLIDNIVKFLIMVAIPVAALLFAYAGFLYFTAGGKEGNIEKAKAIFIDVVFGFILALCGFLIVDTILRTLANGSFVGPGWNTIQCVTGRQIGGPGIGFNDPNVRGLTNPGGAPTGGEVNPQIGSGLCSTSNMSEFGHNASAFSCICAKESGGRTGAVPSEVDRLWNGGQSFSFGRLQINMVSTGPFTCDPGDGGGSRTFDCRRAFSPGSAQAMQECRTIVAGGRNVRVCGSAGFGYTLSQPDIYQECTRVLANDSCNIAAAKYLYDNGGFRHWQLSAQACGAL